MIMRPRLEQRTPDHANASKRRRYHQIVQGPVSPQSCVRSIGLSAVRKSAVKNL